MFKTSMKAVRKEPFVKGWWLVHKGMKLLRKCRELTFGAGVRVVAVVIDHKNCLDRSRKLLQEFVIGENELVVELCATSNESVASVCVKHVWWVVPSPTPTPQIRIGPSWFGLCFHGGCSSPCGPPKLCQAVSARAAAPSLVRSSLLAGRCSEKDTQASATANCRYRLRTTSSYRLHSASSLGRTVCSRPAADTFEKSILRPRRKSTATGCEVAIESDQPD